MHIYVILNKTLQRLKNENRLLRQKVDQLESESNALADRLIQGQVDKAEVGRYRYLYIYVTLYIYIYIISILSTMSGGRDDVCDEEGACGGAAARPGHQHQAGGGPAQVDITSRDASTSTQSFVCLLSGSRGWSSNSREGVRRCSDRRKK